MKRQSLKTVLHALVFTLAIVASFAFKSVPNDAANEVYIHMLPPQFCTYMSNLPPADCSIYNWGANCTTSILGVHYDLHSKVSGLICQNVYRLP